MDNDNENNKKEGLSWWQVIVLIIIGILVLNLSGLLKIAEYVFPQ